MFSGQIKWHTHENEIVIIGYLNDSFCFIRARRADEEEQLRSSKDRVEERVDGIDRIALQRESGPSERANTAEATRPT